MWFPSSHIGSTADAGGNDYFSDRYHHNGKPEQFQGYCTDVFFDQARNWIRQRAQASEPFFAYIPLNAPHGPLFVERRYREPYQDLPAPLANFFGMIANLDENVGRFDQMLHEAGVADNTILVYMTDNGGTAGVEFYNAGMRGRKIILWEGRHRVPCFIRWPEGGMGAGRDENELTAVQDLLPTLTDLCQVPRPPGKLEGVSLAPLLRRQTRALASRMMVVQFSRMNVGRPQWGDAAVLWNKWRLVENDKLYDVAKDPAQQHNRIAEHPDIAFRMRAHYDEWWKNVSPRLDTFLPVHIGSEKENPVLVSPTEWADVFLDQHVQIRRGEPKNGAWHVMVEHEGDYRFALRRWPKEIDVPMTASIPAHKGEIGSYPEGVALPISTARLVIGARDLSAPVQMKDREAVFSLRLAQGWTRMQTWFYDVAGRGLSGAYFVCVERTSPAPRQ